MRIKKNYLLLFLYLFVIINNNLYADKPHLYNSITSPLTTMSIGVYSGYQKTFIRSKFLRIYHPDNIVGQITQLRGDLGEEIMHALYTSELGGSWTKINPHLGVNTVKGIDGLYFKYDQNDIPKDILVSEAKYGHAKLGETKDGLQMTKNWVRPRLKESSRAYLKASESISENNYVRRYPAKTNITQGNFKIDNKELYIWVEKEKYYWSSNSEIDPSIYSKKLSSLLKNTSIFLDRAGDGLIKYRRNITELNFDNSMPKIKVLSELNDSDIEKYNRLKILAKRNKELKLSFPNENIINNKTMEIDFKSLPGEAQEAINNSIKETLQKHTIRNKEMGENEAEIIAKNILENNEVSDLLDVEYLNGNFNRNNLIKHTAKAATAGLLIAIGFDFAGQLYEGYIEEGKITLNNINYTNLATTGTLGGTSGAMTVISENLFKKMVTNSKFLKNNPVLKNFLGKHMSPFLGNVLGAATFSYGSYLLGQVDIETANRCFVAGVGSYSIIAIISAGIGATVGLPTSPAGQFGLGVAGFGFGLALDRAIMQLYFTEDIKKYHENEQRRIEKILEN